MAEKWSPLIPDAEDFWINPEGVIVCPIYSKGSAEIIINQNGEKIVSLKRNKGKDEVLQISLALLVAMHFVPNPFQCSEIEYIDGNVRNCAAKNLRWTGTAHLNIQRMAFRATTEQEVEKEIAAGKAEVCPYAVLECVPEENEHKASETGRKISPDFYFGNPNIPVQIVKGTVILPFDAMKQRLKNAKR